MKFSPYYALRSFDLVASKGKRLLIGVLTLTTMTGSFQLNAMKRTSDDLEQSIPSLASMASNQIAHQMKATGQVPTLMWSTNDVCKLLKQQTALHLFDFSWPEDLAYSIKECRSIPRKIVIGTMRDYLKANPHLWVIARDALLIASKQADSYIVQFLLDLCPGLSLMNSDQGLTALMQAVWCGHSDIVTIILESTNQEDLFDLLCKQGRLGYTALHFAAYLGNSGIVKLLIEAAGQRASELFLIENFAGDTALTYAEKNDLFVTIVDELIKDFEIIKTIKLSPRLITLNIFPATKMSLIPNCESMNATIEGFKFASNLITLTNGTKNLHWDSCTIDGKSYNAETLEAALRDGLVDRYPLCYHRQLKFLLGNEQLIILKHHDGDVNPIEINVPDNIKNRILKYLRNDVHTTSENCLDFVMEICLQPSPRNHFFKDRLVEQIELMDDETLLAPGDAIVLFSKDQSDIAITLKHYAIALGDGIYISKFGNGGLIFVTNLKSMMNYYGCTGFAKIKLEVACFACFQQKGLSTIELDASAEEPEADTFEYNPMHIDYPYVDHCVIV